MKKTVILYIFFLAFSLSSMHAYCGQISRIELTDGSVINGEIISFADGMYDISTDSLGEMKIEAARISKIESVNARPPLTQPNPDAQPANITQPQIDFYKEKLMNNPESMAVVEDMANNTQIQELVNDPDTQEALKSGNVQALMQNEKFMNLTNDPEVQRNIKKLQQGMSN